MLLTLGNCNKLQCSIPFVFYIFHACIFVTSTTTSIDSYAG